MKDTNKQDLAQKINNWTNNIEKTKLDIMMWGNRVNSGDVGDSFYAQNKTRIYTLLIFAAIAGICYWLKVYPITIIFTILLIIQLLSWGWTVLFPKNNKI